MLKLQQLQQSFKNCNIYAHTYGTILFHTKYVSSPRKLTAHYIHTCSILLIIMLDITAKNAITY